MTKTSPKPSVSVTIEHTARRNGKMVLETITDPKDQQMDDLVRAGRRVYAVERKDGKVVKARPMGAIEAREALRKAQS